MPSVPTTEQPTFFPGQVWRPSDGDLPQETELTEQTSQQLGHYTLNEELGRGAYGIVYKAYDIHLRRLVAIKILKRGFVTDAAAVERFARESRAMARIRHDNVVRVFAAELQPVPHIVMDYVPGESLQCRLQRRGAFTPAETARLGAQIARGLAAAHDMGMIHRDVKPGNILLEGEPITARLSDFGLASVSTDASLTISGAVVGTPIYMAPEQAFDMPMDHRADLYSLGCVLYTMLTGVPPLQGASFSAVVCRLITEDVRPILSVRPDVPHWLAAVIDALLVKEPENRCASAAEVARLLETGVAPPQIASAPPRPRFRLPRYWWLAVIPSLIAGITTTLLVTKSASVAAHSAPLLRTATDSPLRPPIAPDWGEKFTNPVGMSLVRLLPGKLTETPPPGVRNLELTQTIYFGTHEVTQANWTAVFGDKKYDRSAFCRDGLHAEQLLQVPDAVLERYPVDGISWADAQDFLMRLNRNCRQSGWVYRLPRSDEWEYVCRGGAGQPPEALKANYHLSTGPSSQLPPESACFDRHYELGPMPVGSYPPNRLGVYDLHGNVIEFCDPAIGEDILPKHCILRGGYWADTAAFCTAKRSIQYVIASCLAGAGFRVVLARVE